MAKKNKSLKIKKILVKALEQPKKQGKDTVLTGEFVCDDITTYTPCDENFIAVSDEENVYLITITKIEL